MAQPQAISPTIPGVQARCLETRFRFLGVAYFFGRPLLLGLGVLLLSLACCRAEENPSIQRETAAPTSPAVETDPGLDLLALDGTGSATSDPVPLLSLAFIGLSGMALSTVTFHRSGRP